MSDLHLRLLRQVARIRRRQADAASDETGAKATDRLAEAQDARSRADVQLAAAAARRRLNDASETDALPLPRYDKLDESQIRARLEGLTQADLAAIETYERAHLDRREVLDKLRYLRMSEPLPGYDGLAPAQISEALAGADAQTVKAVRDYERKFAHRPEVMDEAARVLATAQESAEEVSAREAREARVRDGFASRAKTVDELPDHPPQS